MSTRRLRLRSRAIRRRAWRNLLRSTPSAVLLIGCATTAPRLSAAPQTFNTALPVARGEFVFREQLMSGEAADAESAAKRALTVHGAVSALGFGVTPRVAIFGVMPYLDKSLELTLPGGRRVTRATRGLADTTVFARYTAFRDDAQGRTFRVAPFLGIELPTGADDARDAIGRLPASLQLGSGSRDVLGGVVVTYQTLDYQTDVQLSYKANSEANAFEAGDELRFDASLQYRLWPRELEEGLPGFLYGVIETNFSDQGQSRIGGAEDSGSGRRLWQLSPGLQYVTRRWVVEGIVQVPVSQEVNGAGMEQESTLRVGFRFNF